MFFLWFRSKLTNLIISLSRINLILKKSSLILIIKLGNSFI